MTQFISVQPAPGQGPALAGWLINHNPYIRTDSANSFAVPPELFTLIPEELLTGSIVDGHAYITPEPETVSGDGSEAAPYAIEFWDNSGQPPESVPEGMVVTQLDECGKPFTMPEEPGATPDHGLMVSSLPNTTPAYACEDCDKVAGSAAGLAAHRRAKHGD